MASLREAMHDRKGLTVATATTVFGPFVGVGFSLMAVQYFHTITADWFKAEIVGNKLSVTFDSNGNDQARRLTLEVTAGDIFYTFRFEQSAKQ